MACARFTELVPEARDGFFSKLLRVQDTRGERKSSTGKKNKIVLQYRLGTGD